MSRVFITGASAISAQSTFGGDGPIEPRWYEAHPLMATIPDISAFVPSMQARRMTRLVKLGIAAGMDALKMLFIKIEALGSLKSRMIFRFPPFASSSDPERCPAVAARESSSRICLLEKTALKSKEGVLEPMPVLISNPLNLSTPTRVVDLRKDVAK